MVVAAVCCLTTVHAAAQAALNPPFGLRWGDSPEKLIAWASRHKLDITISLPGDQPGLRIIKIQPRNGFLPDTRAGAVEGRFHSGRLFELTIHYFDATADAAAMEARFEELRRELTREYGELRANRRDRTVRDHFVTKMQSFHHEPVKGLFLLLAYTEMEDPLRDAREASFSLVYRNDNLRMELEQALAAP
jgi:hypothetical protein